MFLAWLRNLPADANLQQGLLGSQDRAESDAGPESDHGLAQGGLAGSPNMGTPAGSAWNSDWKDQARACRASAKRLVNADRILPVASFPRSPTSPTGPTQAGQPDSQAHPDRSSEAPDNRRGVSL